MSPSYKGVLLLIGLLPGLVDAEVYRWVDEHGRVQFGDRPPAGQGEQVKVAPPPPGTAPAKPTDVPDRQRMLDMYQRERERKRAAKSEQARQRAERKRACDETAGILRRYLAGGPLYEDRPDGSRYFYSAAEKDREIATLRSDLARHCGGVPVDLRPKRGR